MEYIVCDCSSRLRHVGRFDFLVWIETERGALHRHIRWQFQHYFYQVLPLWSNVERCTIVLVFCRLNCLLAVGGVQAWLMWNFITFHQRRRKERYTSVNKGRVSQKARQKKQKKIDDEVVPRISCQQWIIHYSVLTLLLFYRCTICRKRTRTRLGRQRKRKPTEDERRPTGYNLDFSLIQPYNIIFSFF